MADEQHIGAIWLELLATTPIAPRSSTMPGRGRSGSFEPRLTRFGNALHGPRTAPAAIGSRCSSRYREYLEADYGTMAAGLVRVPIDPRLTRRDLIALLAACGCSRAGDAPSFADKVEG